MQAPRESLCPLLLGDSNYCTRGHLSRGCGAVKPKPFFSHPSLGQQEPAAAIGPMTAHSEGLLSRAGVMATEGSGGLGRGDLLAASAGAHRPRRGGGGGGGGHGEGCLWSRRLGCSSASACVGVRQTRWHFGPYKLRVCSPQSSSGSSERC